MDKYSIKELEDIMLNDFEDFITNKRQTKKKRFLTNLKVMDYILFISIFSIIGFTVISLYYYYTQGIPVSDLKTEFFYFFGAELLAMAGIAISNNIKDK